MSSPKPFVLIVEDSATLRLGLEVLLEDRFSVFTAETARQGIQLIDNGHSIDLLVTDLDLNDSQDGFDVAQAFRTKHPNAPILLVTGTPPSDPRVCTTLAIPTTRLVSKPFHLNDFERRLCEIASAQIASTQTG